jgi:hypothetical protein
MWSKALKFQSMLCEKDEPNLVKPSAWIGPDMASFRETEGDSAGEIKLV